MTTGAPLPDELLRFMEANVDSIEQLELLRIVDESPDQLWDMQELATQAQATVSSIAKLEERGLLKCQTVGTELRCGPGAMTPEVKQKLDRLLQLYKERPVTLIRIVYERANARLKAFADSFRLRKDV